MSTWGAGDSASCTGWFARHRSALSAADVRRLFAGLLISSVGNWAYTVALFAYVFERTHSLGWVGAAAVVRLVPQLLLGPYGGVIAERAERIRVMVSSDVLSALFQGGMAAAAATDSPVAIAIALAGLTSAAGVVYQPATAAMIPSLVGEDDLAAANALNGTIDELVVIAGPAVGALLLAVGTPSLVFSLNAASFVGSAVLVSRIGARSQRVDVTEGGKAGPLRQMLVGARAIGDLPAARTLVAYCMLVSFVYGTDTVLFVAVSAHRLGTGAEGFGYLLAGLGVGGVLAAGVVDRLAAEGRLASIILAGALGYTLPTALLTVISAPALAFAVEVLRGFSTVLVDVLAITTLQRAVAPDRIARVFGAFFSFALGAIALGTILTPQLVRGLGLDGALWAMALAPAAVALVGYPALLAVDRRTAAQTRALAPRVALLESLGLFAGAGRPALERLAAAAAALSYGAGEVIVREGDPADALYVLAAGEVEVSSRSEQAPTINRPLGVIRAPGFFGEIGLIEGIPRTATVAAVTDCRCERIAGDVFMAALAASPPSPTLIESTRSRLAVTHPSRRPAFDAAQAAVQERALEDS